MSPLLLLLLLPLLSKGSGGMHAPRWPTPAHPPPSSPHPALHPATAHAPAHDAAQHMQHPPAHPQGAAAAARKLIPRPKVHVPRIP